MEGCEGVPLRFPRPATVGIAICLAATSLALTGLPAFADSVRQQEWWLGKLGVTQAWHSSRGSGITVAVLSDGVDASQIDLAGSVTAGPDYTRSGRTASGPYFGLTGTAIASLIAGHGHGAGGADGVIGVAPRARILSVRVILSPGDPLLADPQITSGLPGAIAAGIRYAVRAGARVIDLPLDPGQPGAGGGHAPATASGSPAEKAAVAYALSKGVALVAPAGDDGAGSDAVNYPAAYPGVVSVGAFDRDIIKAPYSSHQPYVTLTAAGAGVITAAPAGYATISSTAAASAVVAGIVALIRSRYPVLSPAQVSRALTHSTKFRPAGGRRDGSGYGTADAAAAMGTALKLAASVRRAAPPTGSRQSPSPPAAAAKAATAAPRVLRAGVITAGILVVLLMLIALYAAAQRRRARRAAAAAAERDRPAPARPAAAAEASRNDPLLAFFSAPTADPARPGSGRPQPERRLPGGHGAPGSRQPAGRGGQDGRSAAAGAGAASGAGSGPAGFGGPGGSGGLSAAGGPGGPAGLAAASGGPGGHDPFTAARDAQGPGGRGGAGERGPRPAPGPALGPAPRPASRRPKVSGAPPWEPAAQPDSELPWATAPAPHAARMPRPAAPAPAVSRPAAAADSAWTAAPAASPAGSDSIWDLASGGAAGSGTAAATGNGPDPDNGLDRGSRPIYVWNPAAATETFPAVPDDRD